MISEQLYDNLGGKLDIQVFTVERWIHYLRVGKAEERMPINRIHNTSFHLINSRRVKKELRARNDLRAQNFLSFCIVYIRAFFPNEIRALMK